MWLSPEWRVASSPAYLAHSLKHGLQLGRGEKKFDRGEASAYTHFTSNKPIVYIKRIYFTRTNSS